MSEILEMKIIARIRNDFPTKFGIPRQSALVGDLKSQIVFEEAFRDPNALREIEQFSHLWLIWQFSEAVRDTWSPTVRPPRLGGNRRIGVFATRSPFRPNPIGLSAVKLEGVTLHPKLGPILQVSGADLMDGTPILDIKPYLPFADAIADASGGYTDQTVLHRLEVDFPAELLEKLPPEKRSGLIAALAQDPRPSYQDDPQRIYGFRFADWEVRFQVKDKLLHVLRLDAWKT